MRHCQPRVATAVARNGYNLVRWKLGQRRTSITVIARRSTAVTITAPLSHRVTQKRGDKNGWKVTDGKGTRI